VPRPGRIFTPTSVQTIRELAGQGKNAWEIAAAIGSTTGSVRVKCSQLKIKLRRGRRPRLGQDQPQQSREARMLVYLRPVIHAALKRKAAQMQKTSDELAKMLLETIVATDLYEAVLDKTE
jgi:hypothetical protein